MPEYNTFYWGVGGLLSASLGSLAILLVAFFAFFFPGCNAYPSPPLLCNGFVSLPLLYAGLAAFLFSIASFERVLRMNKPRLVQTVSTVTRKGKWSRLRMALGKWLFVLGVGLPMAVMIGSIQFDFWLSSTGETGVFIHLFNFDSLVIAVFTALMIGLAYLGMLLCPAIKERIARYTTMGLVLAVILEVWPVSLALLRFG